MKKSIGIFLSVMLTLQIFCIVPVSAAVPSPVFDLDVSSYNETDKTGITNSGSDDDAEISVQGTPKLKTLNSLAGETKYLEFNNAEGTNGGAYVKIEEPDIINSDLTIEMWFKQDLAGGTWSRLVQYSTEGSDATASVDIIHNGSNIGWKPFGVYDTNTHRTQAINGDWHHFVYTRSENSGTWTADIYLDGTPIYNKSITAAIDETNAYVIIGKNYAGSVAEFKLYDTALTAVQVSETYTASAINFVEPANTMGLVEVTPASETISNFPGTIEITFDNYVDKDTIDNITLEMSNGSPISGRYAVEAGSEEYTKTVYIKYGYLEVGKTYVVNIGEGLESINGVAYTGESQIEYRTVSGQLFYEDFSGDEYVVGSPPPTDAGLIYKSTEVDNDASGFTVLETTGGDKYIAGISDGLSKNTAVFYDFEPDLTEGAIAIEIGIKGYVKDSTATGTAVRDFARFINESGNYKTLGSISAGVVMGGTSSTPATDGFSYVKLIASKDSSGYFVYDFYANANSSSYSRVSPMNFSTLSKVMLAHVYPTSEAHVGSDGFAITSINIYRVSSPGVLGGTSGAISKSEDEIDVYFDCNMDIDSLEAATYTLNDASGENSANVAFKSYDEETYTLTLSIEDYLLPEITYTLSIEGAEDTNGSPLTDAEIFDIYLADGLNTPTGAEISALSEGGNVSATVNLPDGASTKYVLMLFDSTGRIRSAKTETITAAANSITMAVDGGVNVGDTVKLFLWEQISSDVYSPVIQPCIIKCE